MVHRQFVHASWKVGENANTAGDRAPPAGRSGETALGRLPHLERGSLRSASIVEQAVADQPLTNRDAEKLLAPMGTARLRRSPISQSEVAGPGRSTRKFRSYRSAPRGWIAAEVGGTLGCQQSLPLVGSPSPNSTPRTRWKALLLNSSGDCARLRPIQRVARLPSATR